MDSLHFGICFGRRLQVGAENGQARAYRARSYREYHHDPWMHPMP